MDDDDANITRFGKVSALRMITFLMEDLLWALCGNVTYVLRGSLRQLNTGNVPTPVLPIPAKKTA
jgi:hypothetical protein